MEAFPILMHSIVQVVILRFIWGEEKKNLPFQIQAKFYRMATMVGQKFLYGENLKNNYQNVRVEVLLNIWTHLDVQAVQDW